MEMQFHLFSHSVKERKNEKKVLIKVDFFLIILEQVKTLHWTTTTLAQDIHILHLAETKNLD
jgi:hypothetical protein